jgi:hypothetical protein
MTFVAEGVGKAFSLRLLKGDRWHGRSRWLLAVCAAHANEQSSDRTI